MHAFRLTEEAKTEGFSGGSVVCSTMGHMFDVKKGLDEGDGVIVTDNDPFAEVLRRYPALEVIPSSDIQADAKPVVLPHIAAEVAPPTGPYTPQTPDAFPQSTVTVAPPQVAEGESPEDGVAAQHSDSAENPQTPEEAVAAGEAVSGSGESSEGESSESGSETSSRRSRR